MNAYRAAYLLGPSDGLPTQNPRPQMPLRQRGKSEATKASSIRSIAVQLCNFPKISQKTFQKHPRTGCQLVNNLAFELVTFLNCSFFKTSMPLSA